MKRFIVITVLFSVSILAAWVIFEAFAASPPENKRENTPINVHNETDEMLKASHSVGLPAPVTGADFKVAPVFDTRGAIVSDPSGTILNSHQSGGVANPVTCADFKVAPVFDTRGAIVSDPSGTILNSHQSGCAAVPVTGRGMNVAPVIDSAGTVVSNPSGLQLNTPNSKGQ